MRVSVLDTMIDDIDMAGALSVCFRAVSEQKLCRVVTPNPEIVLKGYGDVFYRTLLNSAELSIPDGFGLRLVSSLSGRVTGVDLCDNLVKFSGQNDLRIFLLGAGLGVADRAASVWKGRYPGAQVVGSFGDCGYASHDVDMICEKISASGANVVMVAFGAPHQEQWIFDYCDRLPYVYVWLGVGGTFDYVSGDVQRAPEWLRFIGLEWLYRLFCSPHRIFRIFNAVVVFPCTYLFWRVRKLFS